MIREKLVIYLHTDDLSRLSWAVVSVSGQVRESASYDQITELAAIANDKEVFVLVPPEQVFLTQIHLPKMSRARRLAILPYALEDQLIAEVDTLHFATQFNKDDATIQVAVVAQETMQQWLDFLAKCDLYPDYLLPATLALPFTAGHWSLALTPHLPVVRTEQEAGFACDQPNLGPMLELALGQKSLPQTIEVRNYSPTKYAWPELAVPIHETQFDGAQMIIHWAEQIANYQPLNLLQGRYACKKSKLPHLTKLLRITGYLAASWLVLLVAYPCISVIILNTRLHAVNQQIAAIYYTTFPKAQTIVAPRQRMQETLEQLSASTRNNRILLWLAHAGQALLTAGNLQLKRVEFHHNQLTLEVMADTSDTIATFMNYLAQQGLNVKEQQARLADDHVHATLLISE